MVTARRIAPCEHDAPRDSSLPAASSFEELSPPYRTIVADPPWRYDGPMGIPTRVGRVTVNRGAESQYDTMTLSEIKALPVGALADDQCHLYLWVTNKFLRDGFDVMEAWGFTYRATLTWVKQGNLGLGFWFRNQTEHVLFGTRGPTMALADKGIRTYFEAKKLGHSVKPPEFFEIAEKASPGPRVELFARTAREGWDRWGNEAPPVRAVGVSA